MEYKELPGYWEDFRVCTYLRLDEAAALLAGENPHTVVTDGLSPGKAALILREMKLSLCTAAIRQPSLDNSNFENLLKGRIFESLTMVKKVGAGGFVPLKEIQALTIDEIDSSSIGLTTAFASWADEKGLLHYWPRVEVPPYFTVSAKDEPPKERPMTANHSHNWPPFPKELQIAMDAFDSVAGNPDACRGVSSKKALLAWLTENHPKLTSKARERIATIANWEPQGGAPATPTGRGSDQ